MFEAIGLAQTHEDILPADIADETARLLSRFIGVKEPNVRYLALEYFARVRPQHISERMLQSNLPELL